LNILFLKIIYSKCQFRERAVLPAMFPAPSGGAGVAGIRR